MRTMCIGICLVVSIFLRCKFSPTNSDADHDNPDKYSLSATVSDGAGSYKTDAISSVTVVNNLYMLSVNAIETAEPRRQISISVTTTGDPTGKTFLLGPAQMEAVVIGE